MSLSRCLIVLLAFTLGGCASFSGNDLISGKSSASEVERSMGMPARRMALPDGRSVWFYPRGEGRATFAATLGKDGVLQSIEQRLTSGNILKLLPGTTRAQDVADLLGPPGRIVRMSRMERDVWEYKTAEGEDKKILWVQLSYDGLVREVLYGHDFDSDGPSGPGLP